MLEPDSSYTQEWAVYPLPAECRDYYCFINTVRADSKVDTITMPGTGYLSFYPKATAAEVFPPAGFSWAGGDWGEWDDAELKHFYDFENLHFAIIGSELSTTNGVCEEGPLNCEGGCYLDGLPAAAIERWQRLINATKQLGGGQRVHICKSSQSVHCMVDYVPRYVRQAVVLAWHNVMCVSLPTTTQRLVNMSQTRTVASTAARAPVSGMLTLLSRMPAATPSPIDPARPGRTM